MQLFGSSAKEGVLTKKAGGGWNLTLFLTLIKDKNKINENKNKYKYNQQT